MSGSNTEYRRRVAAQGGGGIVRFPDNAGSLAGLDRALGSVADAFNGMVVQGREEANRREVFAADEEARTLTIRDAEGNLMLPEQRDPLTRAGRAFNQGVAKRLADEIPNQSAVAAVQMRQGAGNDPARFMEAWRGYSEGVMGRVPAWLRPEAEAVLGRTGAEHSRGIAVQAMETERRNQAQSWNLRRQSLENDLLGLETAGQGDTPAAEDTRRRYNAHLNDGVTTQQIGADAAQVLRETTAENTIGARIVRETTDRIRGGATREEVLREFDARMDRLALPSPQRERLRNVAEAALTEQDAIRREQRSEHTAAAEDWQARITGGVPVPPDEGMRIVADLERTGAPRLAARVRDINAVQQDARTFAAMSTADLTRKAAEAAGRVARADATARDVALSDLAGRMLQERTRRMADDPLTTAASIHGGAVGPLSELDFGTAEGLASGLRTRERQAAALRAREQNPIPALTKPEAAAMRGLLENGTTDQQGIILSALAGGLSPPTLRATLDSLVRGDGAAPRLQAFVVAAAQTQRGEAGMRLSQDIIRGMEGMRQFRPQAVEGNEPDRLTREELQAVIGSRPDVMAQVGQAARAIYTQRHAGQAGDAADAKTLDATKFRAILGEIMPTVTFNRVGLLSGSQRVPIPPIITGNTPGQRQTAFDTHMAAMPAEALAGARAGDGRPVTVDMVRRGGTLVPTGEGRFGIRMNGFDVLDGQGRTFELDMTRPWPERAAPTQGDAAGPRGIRNNNPLNLSFANQPGAVMETHANPRFARFETMEDGVAASVRQLARYQERGVTTLSAMINRWAPPNENDTPAYVERVSRETGIAPDAVVNMRDPDTVGALVASMTRVETGRALDPDVIRRGVARGIG